LETYYSQFVATNGVSGPGYWEETIGYGMSPGLTAATMPHELVNTGANAFTFRPTNLAVHVIGLKVKALAPVLTNSCGIVAAVRPGDIPYPIVSSQ
jgi:hypothetical protein